MLANRHCFWRFHFCFAPLVLAIPLTIIIFFLVVLELQTMVYNDVWIKYKSYNILHYYILSRRILEWNQPSIYIIFPFKPIPLQTSHRYTHLRIESLIKFEPNAQSFTPHPCFFLHEEYPYIFVKFEIAIHDVKRVIHVNVPMSTDYVFYFLMISDLQFDFFCPFI